MLYGANGRHAKEPVFVGVQAHDPSVKHTAFWCATFGGIRNADRFTQDNQRMCGVQGIVFASASRKSLLFQSVCWKKGGGNASSESKVKPYRTSGPTLGLPLASIPEWTQPILTVRVPWGQSNPRIRP